MKDKKVIIGICIGIFIVISLFIGKDNTTNTNDKTDEQNQTTNLQEESKKYEEIYKDNELINIFLNKYNEIYSDEKITNGMLSVYYHHGSEHKDQVQLTIDGIQVTLTAGNSLSKKISFYMDKEEGLSDNKLRTLTKKFIKVFNSSLSDETIEENLNNQKSGTDINTYEDIEYWTTKGTDNNLIQYLKITGKIE